jgi:hypothetical protein
MPLLAEARHRLTVRQSQLDVLLRMEGTTALHGLPAAVERRRIAQGRADLAVALIDREHIGEASRAPGHLPSRRRARHALRHPRCGIRWAELRR